MIFLIIAALVALSVASLWCAVSVLEDINESEEPFPLLLITLLLLISPLMTLAEFISSLYQRLIDGLIQAAKRRRELRRQR
jgi:hypothetical protein